MFYLTKHSRHFIYGYVASDMFYILIQTKILGVKGKINYENIL